MKIVFLMSILLSLAANANDMVDLGSWRQVGASANGAWSVSSDRHSVFQSINGHPTAFMSTETYDYRTFKGAIRVEDNGGDDDYIGMILGDPSRDFYLFVWKKGATGGVQNGFTLIHFTGAFDQVAGYSWPVFDVESGPNKILAKKPGISWAHNRFYDFEMQVYADRIVTKIDGQTIFDVEGLTIPKSRFGFFNWSQSNVRYNSIRQLYPPIALDKSIEVSQGTNKTIIGSWTDENRNDTHTCELADPPQHGIVIFSPPCSMIFSPNPDVDGVDTFSYKVTDQDGLNTKGIVTANVLSLGTQIEWPSSVVAGQEYIISLNNLASGTPQFPSSTISFENRPAWVTKRGNSIVLNPTKENIGTYKDFRLFASNSLYSNKMIAEVDLQVMAPVSNFDYSNQKFEIVPSQPILLSGKDKQLASLEIPPLISHELNQVEGVHQLVITADADNLSSITVEGITIDAGQSASIEIDLDVKGTSVPLDYSTTLEGKSTFEFEFPWLDSPYDSRYLIQMACSESTSSRCRPLLKMDRRSTGNGDIQAMIRTVEGTYFDYAFATQDWQDSGIVDVVNQMNVGDVLAINLNTLNEQSRAFIVELDRYLQGSNVSSSIPESADVAIIAYRHGDGVLELGFELPNNWGVHRVNWIPPLTE